VRLLFITPEPPYPPARGYSLLTYHHIRELSRRHTIDLVSFLPGKSVSQTNHLKRFCDEIVLVPHSRQRQLASLIRGAADGRPLQVALYDSAEARRVVNTLSDKHAYDAVVCVLTRTAQYIRDAGRRSRMILNMVDPLSLNYRLSLSWRPVPLQPFFREEARRLREYESSIVGSFDNALLICEADAEEYARLLGAPNAFGWIPHVVDHEWLAEGPGWELRKAGSIVMTGNMFYAPNRDAALYFADEIFPLIQQLLPAANLTLAGARPGSALRKLARRPGITVTGAVPDIRPYLHRARVAICPVRLDVGTQTKVLEAMASALPVVTTSAGNRGVKGVSGEHLIVADEPSRFAGAVVSLLRGERWREIGNAGRNFVVANHSPARSAEKLEGYLIGSGGEVSAVSGRA